MSRAGSEAAFFVGVWGKAAFSLHATPGQLAGLMFVLSITSIAGSLLAGALIDRWGPRRVLITFEVLFIPAALAIAAAQTLPQLAAIVGVWAFVGAPVVTAGASFAPFLATQDEGDLKRVNAWIEGAGSMSFVVGPAAGALLVRYATVDWVFILDAATSLAAALFVARVHVAMPERPEPAHGVSTHPFAEFAAGVRTAYTTRSLRFYVLAGSLVWMAFGAFGALEPLFFRDVVGTSVETLGWMNSFFGLGFLTGAMLLPRLPRRVVSATGLAITVMLTGMGTVLYVGSTDLRIIAVGAFLWASVIGVMEPLLRTLLHRDTPRVVLGRVMGTAEVHRRVGELLPLAFAPALATAFGVQPVLIGGGLLATLMAVLAFPEARNIDRSLGKVGATEEELQSLRMADEPISPND